jgi:hypothetical protein
MRLRKRKLFAHRALPRTCGRCRSAPLDGAPKPCGFDIEPRLLQCVNGIPNRSLHLLESQLPSSRLRRRGRPLLNTVQLIDPLVRLAHPSPFCRMG